MERPDRPPDKSTPIDLPTEETLAKLRAAASGHSDPAVRLLADVLSRLAPAVETIGRGIEAVASGEFVSLIEPDVEPQPPER